MLQVISGLCSSGCQGSPSKVRPAQSELAWEDGGGEEALKQVKKPCLGGRTISELHNQLHDLGEVTYSEDEVSSL